MFIYICYIYSLLIRFLKKKNIFKVLIESNLAYQLISKVAMNSIFILIDTLILLVKLFI